MDYWLGIRSARPATPYESALQQPCAGTLAAAGRLMAPVSRVADLPLGRPRRDVRLGDPREVTREWTPTASPTARSPGSSSNPDLELKRQGSGVHAGEDLRAGTQACSGHVVRDGSRAGSRTAASPTGGD